MTYAMEVLADSPLAFWPCDDGSGSPQDSSGNGNHTSGGSTNYETDADLGTVLVEPTDFNTSNIASGLALGTTAWTVEYVGKTAPGGYISAGSAGSPTDGVGYAGLSESSGTLTFQGRWDDNAMSAPAPITASGTLTQDNIWHHIAATWDGTDLKLYVDGSLVDTVSCSGTWTPPADCGFGGTATGDRMWGVAVYDTALSGARIAAHFAELPAFTASVIEPPISTVDIDPINVEVKTQVPGVGFSTIPKATGSYPNPEDAPGWTSNLGDPVSVKKELSDGAVSWSTKSNKIDGGHGSPITTEVQIYRNGHLHAKGPVVTKRASSTSGDVEYSGRGPEWYFLRRVFGTAGRLNFLENGDFEQGMDGWGTNGSITATIETTKPAREKKYLKIVGATENKDYYVTQKFIHDNTKAAYGYWFYCKAWVLVDTYTDAALNTHGLMITFDNGSVKRSDFAPIDAATPRGRWIPLECRVLGEPFTLGLIDVRLYGIKGTVNWDSVQVVGNNFTGGTRVEGTDQALMAAEIVRALQEDRGKSNLGIGRSCPTTGIKYRGIFAHVDHGIGLDALRLVCEHEDGVDQEWAVTPATTTYKTHFPHRGGSFGTFSTGGDQILEYELNYDGSEAASAVIVQGPGDGPARDEGGAIDDSAFGGKVLDRVIQSPQDSGISVLDPMARDELARSKEVPVLVRIKIYGDLIDSVGVGDTGTIIINDNAVTFSDECRILVIDIDCESDTAWLECVPKID